MNNNIIEEWKDINGYEERYQISNTGKVMNKQNGNILSPCNNGNSYMSVQLGRGKRFYIHRLVGQHFLSNTNDYKEMNHINGNRQDNNINNLEWCTRQENIDHKKITGTQLYGSKIYKALLNESQVLIIKRLLLMNKYKQVSIAKVFNVSTKCISDIKLGYTWKHVGD